MRVCARRGSRVATIILVWTIGVITDAGVAHAASTNTRPHNISARMFVSFQADRFKRAKDVNGYNMIDGQTATTRDGES
jgi:hypothetical protein